MSEMVADTFSSADAPILAAQLNPLYRYLRVQLAGHPPALLVLGYLDAHPQGEIEVWYTTRQQVIKIQNGRIIATAGLPLDWRSVRFPAAPPAWSAVPPQGGVYARSRDEMPGHRYAISEQVDIKPWAGVPPIELPSSLPPETARGYQWFREDVLSTSAEPLPPAWFAWGLHQGKPAVVYSEQCLSATFCLKLQQWPPQKSAL